MGNKMGRHYVGPAVNVGNNINCCKLNVGIVMVLSVLGASLEICALSLAVGKISEAINKFYY